MYGRPRKKKKPIPLGNSPPKTKAGPGRKTKFGRAQESAELSRVSYAKLRYGITIRPDEKLKKVKKRMLAQGIGWRNMKDNEIEELKNVLGNQRTPPPTACPKKTRPQPQREVASKTSRLFTN